MRKRTVNKYTELKHDNISKIHCKHCDFIIDSKMLQHVLKYKWFSKIAKSTGKYYAYAHFSGNKKIMLHRFLLNITGVELVDHIDGDTTNNKLNNLRVVSRLQNNVNSVKRKNCKSKYRGVTLRPSGRWGVYIKYNNENMCLGTYDTEEEAASVYNKKAVALYKEYVKLNKIGE